MMDVNVKKVAFFLLLLKIILTISIAIMGYYIMDEAAIYARSNRFCITHDDKLSCPDDTDYETLSEDVGDKEKELEDFITYSVESWYKENRNKDYTAVIPCTSLACVTATLKPNIKLVGYSKLVHGKTEKVVRLEGCSDMSFNHKCQYADGYITVPTTGLYRIYSHLTFRIGNYGKLHTLSHAILAQRSNGKDVLLVNNVMPSCGTTAGEKKVPSFVESVVQLTRGDRLYVEVHAVGEIMPGQENNFFGAFML